MDGAALGLAGVAVGTLGTVIVAYINSRLQSRQVLVSETEAVIEILREDYERVVKERNELAERLRRCFEREFSRGNH